MPNVGKSTLFNALLRRQPSFAEASVGQAGSGGARIGNYPFTTIEPNVGVIPVPDERLSKLQQVIQVAEQVEHVPMVPATIRFVDIAGLVKGAAEGAGLGNKFLSHIREVDLICEVVRAFPDGEIIREGSTEPKGDIEIINMELILADIQTLENQESGIRNPFGLAQGGQGTVRQNAVKKLTDWLNQGRLASEVALTDEEGEAVKELQLLTVKKFVYAFNVNTASEWAGLQEITNSLGSEGKNVVVVDAKLEAELSILSPDEQEEYLESLGVKDSGVNALIRTAYSGLDLISFLTAGVKEVRAWPIPKGTKAPAAAGTIHTDFEKGFIKAEVVDYEDFIRYNGWVGAREKGKARIEGKDYLMKDGDVVEFKVNA